MEIIRLLSREPGAGVEDLRRWSGSLAGVRVVGLGEATHGTREFFTLKHRIIEYLVEECGTRVVAFEASAAAALEVDRWVVEGRGDPEPALRGLGFWTWHTEEVLALLVALRRINEGRPAERRVRFVGVDPQRADRSAAAVAAWTRAVGRGDLAPAVHAVTGYATPRRPALDAQRLDRVREALALLAARAGGAEPVELRRHGDHVARAALLAAAPDPIGYRRVRDRLMAEAVRAAAGRDAGPVAFWAHNGHVRCHADPIRTTGFHLRRDLGRGYYALGLLAGDGSFRARRGRGPLGPARTPSVHRLGPAPTRTVEGRLLGDRREDQVIDLRQPDVADWLRRRGWTRGHGASVPLVPALAATPVTPTEEFDGLAVLVSTRASVPIAR